MQIEKVYLARVIGDFPDEIEINKPLQLTRFGVEKQNGVATEEVENKVEARSGFKKLFYDNLESNCTITCEVSTPPSIEDNTFNWNNINGVTLRVPKGCINDYKNSPWGKFKNIKEY